MNIMCIAIAEITKNKICHEIFHNGFNLSEQYFTYHSQLTSNY